MTIKELNIKEDDIIWMDNIKITFNIIRPNSWVAFDMKCDEWMSKINVDMHYSPRKVFNDGEVWEEYGSCLINDYENFRYYCDLIWCDWEKEEKNINTIFGRHSENVQNLILDVMEEFMPMLYTMDERES